MEGGIDGNLPTKSRKAMEKMNEGQPIVDSDRCMNDHSSRVTDFPKVAIIILNWNEWKDTIECLESLQRITYPNYQIIVVDNGSTDDSVEKLLTYLKKCQDKFRLIVYSENMGFSEGVNTAVRDIFAFKFPPDFVFLLNNDARLEPEALSHCVEVALNENAAIVGMVIQSFVKKETFFAGGKLPHALFFSSHIPINKEAFWSTDLIGGGAVLIRHDFIENRLQECGYLLNLELFMYCDEIEMCWWAKKHNYRILMAGRAIAHHQSKGSPEGKRYALSVYYMTRNRILLARRLLPLGLRLAFHLWYIPSRILLTVSSLLRRKTSVAQAIFMGLFDGYHSKTGKWDKHQ